MAREPHAKLISHTHNPVGLLYYIWMQSRGNQLLESPYWYDTCASAKLKNAGYSDDVLQVGEDVVKIVKQLLHEEIPVLENVSFTFHLTNIPISLREQLVRHRVGVEVGPNVGIDIIPELGKSSFWAQTSRMVSMADFATSGRFIMPKSVREAPDFLDPIKSVGNNGNELPIPNMRVYYDHVMACCEAAYQFMIEHGIPMEDARQVIPLGATHNLTWTMNLKALTHILGKRACWIAQYGLWGSILIDIATEIRETVSPIFAGLVQPPCMDKGKFKSCPIEMINLDRLKGTDPYPPCPLWAAHSGMNTTNSIEHMDDTWFIEDGGYLGTHDENQFHMFMDMKADFSRQWGLDPSTGQPISEPAE